MKESSRPSKESGHFGGAPAPRPTGGGFGGVKGSFHQPSKESFSSPGSFSGTRSNFNKGSSPFSKESPFQSKDSFYVPEGRSTGSYGSSPLLILLVLGVLFVIALCIVGLGLSH